MSAPTVAVEWLLARAAVRQTGLLHVVSRRDSGALNPICGARTISSEKIETCHSLDDVALLCEGCGTIATSMGGTVLDGVALLLGLSSQTSTAHLLEVPVESVTTVAEPRKAGSRLVSAVKQNGIVTPILLRRVGRGLALIDGARRLDAARQAGLTTIPAIVRNIDSQTATVAALLANIHRVDLDPIAQALAYQEAIDELKITKQALADGIEISRSQVSNTIRLLGLPQHLRQHVADGTLTAEQGRALLACATETEQDALADRMLAVRAASGARKPKDAQLVEWSRLVAAALTVYRADIKPVAHGKQIVLTVTDEDLPRILAQFGIAA